MKSISIDNCPAGPSLDAAAAEAMGWTQAERLGTLYWINVSGECQYPVEDVEPTTIGPGMNWQDGDYEFGFRPSTGQIGMAWTLIEDLKRRAFSISIEVVWDFDHWYAQFFGDWTGQPGSDFLFEAEGGTVVQLAITRAFCKAHGITEVKVDDG